MNEMYRANHHVWLRLVTCLFAWRRLLAVTGGVAKKKKKAELRLFVKSF